MSIISRYNKSLNALYDHVGCVENTVAFPILNLTRLWWAINSGGGEVYGKLVWSHRKSDVEKFLLEGDVSDDSQLREGEIFESRFYTKSVYRGKKYTMVLYDSRTNGYSKEFAFVSNDKEVSVQV